MTKSTILPGDPDDLICQQCPNRFAYRGSATATRDGARTAGWHVLEGDLRLSFRALCPECIGTPRTRIPAPSVLEGQGDILDSLGVVAPSTTAKGRKKQPRKGIN